MIKENHKTQLNIFLLQEKSMNHKYVKSYYERSLITNYSKYF